MQPAYGHPQFPVGSIFERLVHVRGQIRGAGVNPPLAQLVNGDRAKEKPCHPRTPVRLDLTKPPK